MSETINLGVCELRINDDTGYVSIGPDHYAHGIHDRVEAFDWAHDRLKASMDKLNELREHARTNHPRAMVA